MKVKAYAKANLGLDVLGRREDGYHLMDMVNARCSLYDELDIEPADQDEIICEGMKLPASNTLSNALDELRKVGLKGHYRITLTKNIPSQAGLGGGSADAAALLEALNEIEDLRLSIKELETIGARIGADVPCCLHDGFTRVKGIGEVVTDLNVDWRVPVVFVQGVKGISTAEAFARLEENGSRALDIDIIQDAVRKKDIGLLYQTMTNAFEPQAFEALDELPELKMAMQDAGLVRIQMSGSGSCLMGFSVDDEVIDKAVERLSEKYPFVQKGWLGK